LRNIKSLKEAGLTQTQGRTNVSSQWTGGGDILNAGGYTFYVAENNQIVPLTTQHLVEIASGDKLFVSTMREILTKLPVTS
jgi:hypothetical protein